MSMRIRLRGGLKKDWEAQNPVLSYREMVLETDTHKIKVGDGTTRYNDLPYYGGGGDIDLSNVEADKMLMKGADGNLVSGKWYYLDREYQGGIQRIEMVEGVGSLAICMPDNNDTAYKYNKKVFTLNKYGAIKLSGGDPNGNSGQSNDLNTLVMAHTIGYVRLSGDASTMISYSRSNDIIQVGDVSPVNGKKLYLYGTQVRIVTPQFLVGTNADAITFNREGGQDVIRLQGYKTYLGATGRQTFVLVPNAGAETMTRVLVQKDDGRSYHMTKAEFKAWLSS